MLHITVPNDHGATPALLVRFRLREVVLSARVHFKNITECRNSDLERIDATEDGGSVAECFPGSVVH